VIDVAFWPIATFRGDAAIQSLSERSGRSASRAYRTGFYEYAPEFDVEITRASCQQLDLFLSATATRSSY